VKGLWWRGWDGSLWDLINGPVPLSNKGLRGLQRSMTDVRTTSSSNRDGQRQTGSSELARQPIISVVITETDTELEWVQLYRAWSRSFDSVKYGALIYLSQEDELLEMACRLERAPDNYDEDWARWQFMQGTWELVADDPYWYLPTVSEVFESASTSPVNYYGGDGASGGYPLVRSAGRQAGRKRITNAGSEPVHWSARFAAPSAGFEVEIDGHTVAGAYPIPDGAILELDSENAAFWLWRAGTREHVPYFEVASSTDFAQLQPGDASEIRIVNQGAGVPTFTYRPRRKEAL